MPDAEKVKVPTAERLLNLSVFLLEERRPQTLREIVDKVEGYDAAKDYESNRRMFIRDRKTLSELDINIRLLKTEDAQTGRETEAYTVDAGDLFLPRITFTEEETRALAGLGARFRGAMAAPLNELEWALAKIMSSGGRRAAVAPGADSVLVHFDLADTGTDPALVEAVQAAVADRRRLNISYKTPGSGRGTARKVDPYGLFLRRGLWYLVGRCHLRGGLRMFRLDRLELSGGSAKRGAPEFDVPADFSLEEYLKRRAPWEFGDERAVEIAVKLDRDVFWQVRNAWGDLESVAFDEKKQIMKLISVNEAAVISWLLGFGSRAEPVSPAGLRKKVAAALKTIVKNHENG